MTDNSKFKLGLFIIIAVVVFFAGLMILGSFEQFKEKAYVTTLFSESVQGLSVGSSVKYMGVPVGTVRDISIYPNGSVIRIDMEIKLASFRARTAAPDDADSITVEEFQNRIAQAVDRGLRCRMELEGITGSKYIELNFDPEAPASAIDASQYAIDHPYVPSLPSLISDLRGSVTSILAKLESIDYKGISDRANDTLDTLNSRLSSPKFDETIDNANSMITSARKSIENLEKLTDADVRGQLENLTANAKVAITAVESLAKTVEQEIKSAEFEQIADNVRAVLANAVRASRTLDETLFNVNNGVDALIELIQYIDSDPSSIIQGKKKRRIDIEDPGPGTPAKDR